MSTDSQWAVQQAVYAALAGDGALMALVAGVHDHPPEGAAPFPYVLIGESTARDWSGAAAEGMELTLTLHAWSRYRGFREVKAILAAIHSALHDATLALAGQTLVNLRFDFAATMRDPDGLTTHGVARYRAVTQAT